MINLEEFPEYKGFFRQLALFLGEDFPGSDIRLNRIIDGFQIQLALAGTKLYSSVEIAEARIAKYKRRPLYRSDPEFVLIKEALAKPATASPGAKPGGRSLPVYYAYIRVSTDRQSVENQRFEILKAAQARKVVIDQWIEETVSGTKAAQDRQLGFLISQLKEGDQLFVSELSRIGRSLFEIMSILHKCMEVGAVVVAIKEGYELGKSIESKVLAFAFSLSAEIERQLISQRTKEALARKKSEGAQLGRPPGSRSANTKLSGKEEAIEELIRNKVSHSAIGRILGVNRQTVTDFINSRNLNDPTK